MINTYDVKAKERLSDDIFNSFNRLNSAKNNGALDKKELSQLIIKVGDLFANKVKQGRVSEEEVESVESYLTGFTGINKDKYFPFPHEELDVAAKSFLEGNYFAKEEINRRNMYSQPAPNSESYAKGFRRLGN